MDQIVIARFRSSFEGGRAVLTAEMVPRPTERWRELCQANLARYAQAFERTPELVADAIVVSTTPWEVATAEMALETLVRVTNQLDAQELVERA
jgi:hypothetical protein